MPYAIDAVCPIEPTVKKSLSCPLFSCSRISNISRDVLPVVETIKSSSPKESIIAFRASSLVILYGDISLFNLNSLNKPF